MPELPEVETVKRGLEPVFEGAICDMLELRRENLRFPFPVNFAEKVSGCKIKGLSRRAKYLLIELDNGYTIISHLGMSGSFRVLSEGDEANQVVKHEKHDHVIFHLRRNGVLHKVHYNDPRRFGFMDICQTSETYNHAYFKDLGPEPIGNSFDAEHLAKRFKDRKTSIKSALLDQKNVAGLGNIYVCEALWRAKIDPQKAVADLVKKNGQPTNALVLLVPIIREVIAQAIKAGGSSLNDHIQTDGSLGYFQHSFSVYGREGKFCASKDCGANIERIVQSGRSTFYCSKCQK